VIGFPRQRSLCFAWVLIWVGLCRGEVLLLKNGNTLEGGIRRTHGSYVVRNADGEVYASAEDVLARCENLNQAYQWKVARTPHDAQPHVRLAQWCLSHGLINEARQQISYLEALAPQHSAIAVLREQIRLAHAGHQPAVANVPPPVPLRKANQPESELDVEPDVLRRFTRTIQPLLLNRCGATACHGRAGTSSFAIVRPLYGNTRRELTFRNLAMTLSLVDPANPVASDLLKYGTTVHGSASEPPIAKAETVKIERLKEWMVAASRTGPDRRPEETASRAAASVTLDDPGQTLDVIPRHELNEATSVADPFDPRRFNEQFRTDTP
jgi:hypothetical protein